MSGSRLRRTLDVEGRRLRNRVLSIAHDAKFVRSVVLFHYGCDSDDMESAAASDAMPVYANLRCGLWYAVCARVCSGTAYFKSTDGHANVWNFSLRRLNLHVASQASSTGVFLVDATKRGRILPDAFARTLPIWCATLNRAIARYRGYLDEQGRDCREDDDVWWDWNVRLTPSSRVH